MTTTKIDPRGGVTRYLQLYAALSQELAEGVIDPGDLMPSEPSLVRKYRVSRTTVRRALARLESEGRIVRRRGSGTFASGTGDGPLRPGERVTQVQGEADATPTGVRVRTLDAQIVETPAIVQKSMPNFGKSALMVRTLRSLRRKPFVLATSYFVNVSAGGPGEDQIEASAREIAAGVMGGEQIVTAIAADAFTARQLGVPAGAPLLQVRRLLHGAGGKPLEYQDMRYRADLFELRMVTAADIQPLKL